jgi:NAD(P)-dependent dehydrogenase (short-subunit alcohol dehydrogenase family)
MGTVADVAGGIVFLASDDAGPVRRRPVVDGGWIAQ